MQSTRDLLISLIHLRIMRMPRFTNRLSLNSVRQRNLVQSINKNDQESVASPGKDIDGQNLVGDDWLSMIGAEKSGIRNIR